ncbi:FG-GAP-like repeat-containing protein [Bacteroidota bacterium]
MILKCVIFRRLLTSSLFFWCIVIFNFFGQYQNTGLTLTGTHSSAVHWVDIDGDGDLDASISGNGEGELIILESESIFDTMKITPLSNGDMTWCDFNNDSIPDLLYTGNYGGLTAGIDTFNISDSLYNNYFSDFTAVQYASVDWGDYDNDGDYDALIAGLVSTGNIYTTLYQNNNGSFEDVQAGLPGILIGQVGFIDYDVDRDLDIFITGQDINSNKYTRLWQNNDGIYSITSDLFLNVYYSQFDWGDFNDDGYPDLVLGGFDGTKKEGIIYINNSGSGFSLSDTIVPGTNRGSSGFGDVDQDGDLDVFVSGIKQISSLHWKMIYDNDGTDSLKPANFTITPFFDGSFQFGDFDNDYDLDFVVNGKDMSENGVTLIYEDTCSTSNSRPTAPLNLNAYVTGTSVQLTWDHGTDNNTSQNALTYNIYMGTTSKGIDVVSPHATITNGFRKISKQGYIQDTSWMIKNLSVGTYYWGVQAIDNSFAPSVFSIEDTFEINDRFSENKYVESPNITSPAIYFDCDQDEDYDLLLAGDDELIISENSETGFSHENYDTVYNESYNPINTVTPNDYNNDNIIDFSISGDYTADELLDSSIALFGYESDFNYTIIDSSLAKNVDFEYVLWADFNNDGLQDFISSGRTTNLGASDKPVTYIYKNLGNGNFTKVSDTIRGFEDCGAVSADFDNDMDIDMIIYGKDSTTIPNTFIYVNNGDFSFTELGISNNQLYRYLKCYGIVSGDFDLNGDLDVYLAGKNSQNDHYARVLLNNSLNFSDANLSIRSWSKMANYWADYDYDGDLDIFSTSVTNPYDEMKLYLNNNNSLEELTVDYDTSNLLSLPFIACNLDNQNGLDFTMKISHNDSSYVHYYDNYVTYNKLDVAPTNLDYERDSFDVILTWDKLVDCPGYTYNIWVGTHLDSVNIMSPMADKTTGFRYVIQPGNAYLNSGWRLKDLPPDKYFWSVQAIDLANEGGPWAPTDSFTITNVNASFTFDTVCLGDTTYFTDETDATETLTVWKWYFTEDDSSSLQNPKHLFTASGNHEVTLIAYTENYLDTIKQTVVVKKVPDADFTADIACEGIATSFTNTSDTTDLTIDLWKWKFTADDSIMQTNPGSFEFDDPGNYDVQLTILADNSCTDTISKSVTVADYPVAFITAEDGQTTKCEGDSAKLEVNGGYNSNYLYQWRLNNADITNADSNFYYAKDSGYYKVVITSKIGSCETISNEIKITVSELPPVPTINNIGDTTFCTGDSVILSITDHAEYAHIYWLEGGGLVESDTLYYKVKSLTEESYLYSVIVENSDGCKDTSINTKQVTINLSPDELTIYPFESQTICQRDSITFNVSYDPLYNYQWKQDNIDVGIDSNKFISDPLTTGTYTYTVDVQHSVNGCVTPSKNSVDVNVIENPNSLTIEVDGPTEFCDNDSVELSVNYYPDYTYQWIRGTTELVGDTNVFNAKIEGNYRLEVTSDGCDNTSANTVDVVVNTLPVVPTVNVDGTRNFCEGESVRLYVDKNSNYTYQWKNRETTITGATDTSYTATDSGDYYVVVKNKDNICYIESEEKEVIVRDLPLSLIIDTGSVTTFCQGDSVELIVTHYPDYTYQWIRGTTELEGDTNVYNAKVGGNYRLEVTSNGCDNTSANAVDVVVNTLPVVPTVNVDGTRNFCEGESVRLYVDKNSNYTYQWKNRETTITGATDTSYTATDSGNYYVVVKNKDNICYVETEEKEVIVKDLPLSLIIDTGSVTTFCQGDSVLLSVTNYPDYAYKWKQGNQDLEGDTNIYIAKSGGVYSLEVTSETTECSNVSANTVSVTVNIKPSVPPVVQYGLIDFCEGDSVRFSVERNSNYSYQWQNSDITISGANDTSYVARAAGNFILEIKNANGCKEYTEGKEVLIRPNPPSPTIDYSGLTTFCQGSSLDLSVTSHESYDIYEWLIDDRETGIDTNIFNADESGTYSLIVYSSNQCFSTSSNSVDVVVNTVPDIPTVSNNGSNSICEGEQITLTINNPDENLSYQWQNGDQNITDATNESYIVNETGNYKVRATNSDNCENISSINEITVNEIPPKPVIIAGGNTDICLGDIISLEVEIPFTQFNYQWKIDGFENDTATSYKIKDALPEGKYTVEAKIGNCATESDFIEITHKDAPEKPELVAFGPVWWYLACSNDTATTYYWYYNGDLLPGQNERDYVAGQNLGEYYVEINEGGECNAASNPITIGTTAIQEESIFGEIKIFPNPTSGLCIIEMSNNLFGEINIDVTNETGGKVSILKMYKNTPNYSFTVDLRDQEPGFYFIGFKFDEGYTVRKLVVE